MQGKGWLRQGTEVGIVPARAVLRLAAGFGPWDIESSPRIAFVRCGVVRRSRAEHRFVRSAPHTVTHTRTAEADTACDSRSASPNPTTCFIRTRTAFIVTRSEQRGQSLQWPVITQGAYSQVASPCLVAAVTPRKGRSSSMCGTIRTTCMCWSWSPLSTCSTSWIDTCTWSSRDLAVVTADVSPFAVTP